MKALLSPALLQGFGFTERTNKDGSLETVLAFDLSHEIVFDASLQEVAEEYNAFPNPSAILFQDVAGEARVAAQEEMQTVLNKASEMIAAANNAVCNIESDEQILARIEVETAITTVNGNTTVAVEVSLTPRE
jgi:hypothetical protein